MNSLRLYENYIYESAKRAPLSSKNVHVGHAHSSGGAPRAGQGGAGAGTALGSLPMCRAGAGPSTRLLSTLTWSKAGHGQGSSAWGSLLA